MLKRFLTAMLAVLPVERVGNLYDLARTVRLKKGLCALGNNVVIGQGFYIETPEKVTIEDHVSIARQVRIMGAGNVTIHEGAMIASGVTILTTSHDPSASVMKTTGFHRAVSIGRNSWIGTNALILPGVVVGTDAIVGAGTVVTKPVPDKAVVTGVEEQFRRFRI